MKYYKSVRVMALAAAIYLLLGTTAAWATTTKQLTATRFVQQVKSGAPIDFTGLEIIGTVDLSPLRIVKQAIRCRDCQVVGDLVATDVTFSQSIDLENVAIRGRLDAGGATFDGPMLARGNGSVAGAADLSFAQFERSSAFDGLSFDGPATFEGANFDNTATFTGTTFSQTADFDRVNFAQGLDFGGSLNGGIAQSHGNTTFRLAAFGGPADFGQRVFDRDLSLNHARADDTVSLADTQIFGTFSADGGLLHDVDAKKLFVQEPASLYSTQMQSISLNSATFGCSLDLRSATVVGRATLRDVSLRPIAQPKTACPNPGQLLIDDFSSGQLAMDRTLVRSASDDQSHRAALEQIETFERTSGSVTDANGAHFQLLALDAKTKTGFDAFEDWAYRQVGGYLVRPLRPLRALAIIVLFATVLRWWAADRLERATHDTHDTHNVVQRAKHRASRPVTFSGRHLTPILQNLTTSLVAAFRPTPDIEAPSSDADAGAYFVAAAKVVEYLSTKALIFTFLLCLANYNTTLHDLVKGLIPS